MGMTNGKPGPRPGTPEYAAGLERFTVATHRIAAAGGGDGDGVNAFELRNEVLVEMEKARIRYENGRTLAGYQAERLFEDARRMAGNHRRTLARNLDRASGQPRPAHVSAHHIVASGDVRAEESRDVIFRWGIAINDADNGVYLPRSRNTPVPSMPNAAPHGPIHTTRYHANVAARLIFGDPQDAPACRAILRVIKRQLVDGSFPWSEA